MHHACDKYRTWEEALETSVSYINNTMDKEPGYINVYVDQRQTGILSDP